MSGHRGDDRGHAGPRTGAGGRAGSLLPAAAAAVLAALAAGGGVGDAAPAADASAANRELIAVSSGRRAELRKTVPIARKRGRGARVVISLGPGKLPRLRVGDRLRVSAEVAATTTCVTRSPRCIGRRYSFDPHVGARIYLSGSARAGRRASLPVSSRVSHTCGQRRPNRNHHCPLVIETAGTRIDRLRDLPCRPDRCHLNLVLDAHHRRARSGQVVVVGIDRPDGGVSQRKGRLDAVLVRKEARVGVAELRSSKRRTAELPIGFSGGHRVVYSQRLGGLRRGDVLLVRARQRTRIRHLPYFVANRIVVSTRPGGIRPSRLVARTISASGWVTETNGFNCTPGPSAFRSPCVSRKVGIVKVIRPPRGPAGRRLFVNLVSRSFPKRSQGGPTPSPRSSYPRARILPGGSIEVERLRAR